MVALCSKCNEELPTDHALCKGPRGCRLHFGLCAGIQESSWRKGDKSDWKCPECRKVKDQPPVSPEELRNFMTHVREKLKPVEEIAGLKTLVTELKTSVEFVTQKYDDVIKRVENVEATQTSTANTIKHLNHENRKKETIIEELNARLRDTEQYARNRNIEVSGLEVKTGENLVEVMANIVQKIGVPFKHEDIDVIHRVPSRSGDGPPRVIAQFSTRKKRDEFLKHKNSDGIVLSKDVVVGGLSDIRVYLHTHLTLDWKRLLRQIKQAGRPLGYKSIWYKDNRIIAKKDVNDMHPIYITKEADLVKLR